MDYRGKTFVKNILLTGATGVLGGRLLQEILTATDATVYCLVRADSHHQAQQRLEGVLFAYDETQSLRGELWRAVPVLGDVTLPRLGLSAGVYQELVSSVDLVLHCAANVSLVAAFSKIGPVNVGGTQGVIDFCLAGDIPLLFTSSFSMIGDKLYEKGFVSRETDLDVGQGFDEMDYERSKLEAEKAIHAAGARGLDWVIVRPGNIWGDSVTGCYPLAQTRVRGILYESIRSLVETGLGFASDEDYDVTPVDYVAKASLYAIMNLHVTNHRTYHVLNPNPIDYDRLTELLREYGYSIRMVDSQEFFDALREQRVLRAGRPYRSMFTDLLAVFVAGKAVKECAKWDTTQSTALLRGTGIVCHPTDRALMSKYLGHAIKVGLIPEPAAQHPLAEISKAPVLEGFMERLYDGDDGVIADA